jgi:L-ribulokinase
VGGAYKTTAAAQAKMTGVKSTVYRPRKAASAVYAELYGLYRALHDSLGVPGTCADLSLVMKQLIAIRDRVRKD